MTINRREFLSLTAAGAAMAALPVLPARPSDFSRGKTNRLPSLAEAMGDNYPQKGNISLVTGDAKSGKTAVGAVLATMGRNGPSQELEARQIVMASRKYNDVFGELLINSDNGNVRWAGLQEFEKDRLDSLGVYRWRLYRMVHNLHRHLRDSESSAVLMVQSRRRTLDQGRVTVEAFPWLQSPALTYLSSLWLDLNLDEASSNRNIVVCKSRYGRKPEGPVRIGFDRHRLPYEVRSLGMISLPH